MCDCSYYLYFWESPTTLTASTRIWILSWYRLENWHLEKVQSVQPKFLDKREGTVLFESGDLKTIRVQWIKDSPSLAVVELVDGDRVDDIALNFEFGFGVVLSKKLVVALGWVDHQQFEELAHGKHNLLAYDQLPVKWIYLFIQFVSSYVFTYQDLFDLWLLHT